VVMDPRLFGHQSLEPEVFWNDWQLALERGSQDLWRCCIGKRSLASNEYLWKLTREHFPTVPSWLTTSIAYWKPRISLANIELVDASIYRLGFLTSRATTLPQSEVLNGQREEVLSRFRDPSRPYVVFTVREFNRASNNNELRNRQIADFVPAMTALTQRGFNVIRLTSRTNDPIVGQLDGILDWQVLEDGRPGDELAIISGATFVVSTTTGGDCLALAYRRPVLYLDAARFYLVFLGTELATFQVPRIEVQGANRLLNLAEILDRSLGWVAEQESFEAAGVRVVNSTPDEIREHVLEYLATDNWKNIDVADRSEAWWREALLARHNAEVMERHGPVRARMHPASKRALLPAS